MPERMSAYDALEPAVEAEVLRARLAELEDELLDLDDRRAQIKGQIEKAQADRHLSGEYADADWFRRAKGALRHAGVERSEICREIGETNRRIRALGARLSRDTFREAVKEIVDAQVWAAIVARAAELGGAA